MRKLLDNVGSTEAISIIRTNHAVETMRSATRRRELNDQLSNPKAGALAHLENCRPCTLAVEARAAEFEKISLVSLGTLTATATATAVA